MMLVVAEKPSVARAIARTLKTRGIKVEVLGLRGHLLDAELPRGYEWNRVNPREIFGVRRFRSVVRDRESYGKLSRLLGDHVEELVIATDNDGEGELIGSEVLSLYRRFRNSGRFSRMRFNSVSEVELWRAWNNREPDLNWRWVWKATYRRNFDLVTGAAFTRLLTMSARRRGLRGLISWGSCQTPTLNYLVVREEEILGFKPKPYWVVKIRVRSSSGEEFEASSGRFYEREEAGKAYEKALGERYAVVEAYEEAERAVSRPTPLRTDEMLRDLNRITGMSAASILRTAEELYSEGYISYPRTDTNRWPKGFDHRVPAQAARDAGILEEARAAEEAKPLQGRLDDHAHPPIYPIKPPRRDGSLRWRLWEYIARRYSANAFFDDALLLRQKASLRVGDLSLGSQGLRILEEGFYEVYPYFKPKPSPLPRLKTGERLEILEVRLVEERTKPPPRLTEAALLKLMERDGIGTDATRAEYPRILLQRGYAVKSRRTLKPTKLGMTLITQLRRIDERLVSPQTRRLVEENMRMIGEGLKSYEEAFEETIKIYSELYKRLEGKAAEIGAALSNSRRIGS